MSICSVCLMVGVFMLNKEKKSFMLTSGKSIHGYVLYSQTT